MKEGWVAVVVGVALGVALGGCAGRMSGDAMMEKGTTSGSVMPKTEKGGMQGGAGMMDKDKGMTDKGGR